MTPDERELAGADPERSVPLTVEVRADGTTYPVLVGAGVRHRLSTLLSPSVRRVAVVTQAGIGLAVDPGREHEVFTIAEGEAAKSLATVEGLCRAWSRWGLTRADQVVAVGGGLVTDVAGFAAAVYHRGVGVIHVPTTLLGMVDAAIGGKTGVNLPEGKNLVGAFWQPSAVLCDTRGARDVARTRAAQRARRDGQVPLPDRRRPARAAARRARRGLRPHQGRGGGGRRARGPRQPAGRATLNYGHTLAHALETAGRYDLRHGEAVAIGLVYAAELARLLGRIDGVPGRRAPTGGRRATTCATVLPEGVDRDELVVLMTRDKKAVDGLTFVLDGPDGVEVVPGVDPDDARAALDVLAGER